MTDDAPTQLTLCLGVRCYSVRTASIWRSFNAKTFNLLGIVRLRAPEPQRVRRLKTQGRGVCVAVQTGSGLLLSFAIMAMERRTTTVSRVWPTVDGVDRVRGVLTNESSVGELQ
jgi:hypothetical protein